MKCQMRVTDVTTGEAEFRLTGVTPSDDVFLEEFLDKLDEANNPESYEDGWLIFEQESAKAPLHNDGMDLINLLVSIGLLDLPPLEGVDGVSADDDEESL